MTSKQRTIYRFLITSAALLGLVIMSYLTYIHYANTSSFCDISKEVSCDVVTTSLYSEVFGLPVSVLGLGYFLFKSAPDNPGQKQSSNQSAPVDNMHGGSTGAPTSEQLNSLVGNPMPNIQLADKDGKVFNGL